MVYSSDRTKPRTLYLQATDGSGTAEHLVDSPGGAQNATSWSADGRWVAFEQYGRNTNSDVWVLSMDGERRARPFLQSAFAERQGVFSPDGRWMAFTTDESGRPEVMVTAFPGPGPASRSRRAEGACPPSPRRPPSLLPARRRHLGRRAAHGGLAVVCRPEARLRHPERQPQRTASVSGGAGRRRRALREGSRGRVHQNPSARQFLRRAQEARSHQLVDATDRP